MIFFRLLNNLKNRESFIDVYSERLKWTSNSKLKFNQIKKNLILNFYRYIPSTLYPAYISTTQRQCAVNEILETTEFGSQDDGEVGINRLLKEDIIKAAYPLHDGDSSYNSGVKNPRSLLNSCWSRYTYFYKFQPIDNVRDYFGEKIGFYFAWLGAYTTFLLAPSLIGLIVFLINVIMRKDDVSM
jgi:hypothetical protein